MSAIDELRSTINDLQHQDMPLQSIKDELNDLLDEVETMNGGSNQIQTAVVTTDSDTFEAEHVFDLGSETWMMVKSTITALTPDGETFGSSNGDIHVVNQGADGFGPVYVSFDNIDFVPFGDSTYELGQLPSGVAVSDMGWITGISPRYVKVPIFIVTNFGVGYVGPNHPTATVQIDVIYE